ncbi:GDP-mannose-dependent alpha-mannosyltransferase [Pelotomaculum sp. FP]|uniref:glycosyltransferase family 4 protein n=1 Tax=Pelotomaculum sp. FP TaxID=261474 RepID=UPI001065E120|nr:glycosyltransferase family 1 protein [Pelotomaculum sp. FP]TEB14882.1 GDP-mannose-dependent alpha-mannosyltransferase [Pelotomaculum sp. FP]
MKIAFFTDTYLPQLNGVSTTMQQLFSYLDKIPGFEYIVFAPGPDTSTDKNIYRIHGMKFFLYPECRVSIPNYYYIKKILNRFKPDLIHDSTQFSIGLCGLLYARKNSIPITTVYHTNFSDYLAYYRLRLIDRVMWRYFTWFHNQCDINFCPSLYTRDELLQRGMKNLELWVRGVDTDFFSPKYKGILSVPYYHIHGKTILLYVGRVAAEKNIGVLMHAMEIINAKFHNKVHLFIVGDGPMLKQIERCMPGNVTCTGFLTGLKLAKMYANADIFVFPSTSETFGNVVLEAMSSGIPVVGAFSGGVQDSLIDGENGISCTPGDPASLADGVIRLLRNREQLKMLGKQARAHALEMSLETGFEQLIKRWAVLLNESKAPLPVSGTQHILNQS